MHQNIYDEKTINNIIMMELMENKHWLLYAHRSAGKTVVVEYAIAF
jgi:superfamily II RNA helicase